MTQAPSRREKHKTQTRQVLRETALQLFASQGYDSTTAEEVVSTLRSLSGDQGTTVIVVTHAEDVAQHARRRIKLRDGRLMTEPRPSRPGRLRAT